MLGRLIGTAFGAIVSIVSGYGIYRLVDMIISGVSSQNWLMVIAGGILIYLFIGLLVLGVIAGGVIILLSLAED